MYPLLHIRYNLGRNRWRSFLCAGLSNRGKRGEGRAISRALEWRERWETRWGTERSILFEIKTRGEICRNKIVSHLFEKKFPIFRSILYRFERINFPSIIRYAYSSFPPLPSFGSISARAGKQGIGGGRRKGGNTLRDGIACLFWFIRIRHEPLTYLPKSGLTPASF